MRHCCSRPRTPVSSVPHISNTTSVQLQPRIVLTGRPRHVTCWWISWCAGNNAQHLFHATLCLLQKKKFEFNSNFSNRSSSLRKKNEFNINIPNPTNTHTLKALLRSACSAMISTSCCLPTRVFMLGRHVSIRMNVTNSTAVTSNSTCAYTVTIPLHYPYTPMLLQKLLFFSQLYMSNFAFFGGSTFPIHTGNLNLDHSIKPTNHVEPIHLLVFNHGYYTGKTTTIFDDKSLYPW